MGQESHRIYKKYREEQRRNPNSEKTQRLRAEYKLKEIEEKDDFERGLKLLKYCEY